MGRCGLLDDNKDEKEDDLVVDEHEDDDDAQVEREEREVASLASKNGLPRRLQRLPLQKTDEHHHHQSGALSDG